jgi:hypothetical protein
VTGVLRNAIVKRVRGHSPAPCPTFHCWNAPRHADVLTISLVGRHVG